MKLKDYLIERLPFLLLNLVIFIIIVGMMELININRYFILLIFFIWFVPILTYISIEFIKRKTLFTEVNNILDHLDKKFLLPEIMKKPEDIEGKFLYDVLRRTNKDMHEHVKNYRDRENEYREYIETWVHEIKTPIASTRLIIENNPNNITRNINDEIKKIEEYIEQVLYYSRSNNVSKDYIIKEVSLSALVKTVIKRNSRDFISKGIKIDMESVKGTVYSDAKWLEFIVNQLIGNATKYNQKSDGRVTIYTISNENNTILTIEDNGIGIIDKDINRVFEKGFTGDNGRKYGKSTGLGLYLCKKLAEQLGLGITLTSEAGEGTKVSIIFPLGKVNLIK